MIYLEIIFVFQPIYLANILLSVPLKEFENRTVFDLAIKFGTDVRHLCQTEPLTFQRSCRFFLARDSMLSALYAIANPSVCLSVTRVDQSKTV